MNTKDAIRTNLETAHFVLSTSLSDLEDKDLLIRSLPNANHIAWQLGHLITSCNSSLQFLSQERCPALPEGFESSYSKEKAKTDTASSFHSKETYIALFKAQKDVINQLLEELPDEKFDQAGPESMRSYAPTIGVMFMMFGTHIMMHLGQIAVVRRYLEKPVLI